MLKLVMVMLHGTGVAVAVAVGVTVGVGVRVAVAVGDGVGVWVGVPVGVGVGVDVGDDVGVEVGGSGVAVSVLVMPSPLCRREAARWMLSRGVADDGYGRVALTRSVVVGDVDPLPCAEHQLAIAHRQRHIVPRQHTFDVRVRISLGMTELFLARHELSEV